MNLKKLLVAVASTSLLLAGCEEQGIGPAGNVSQVFGGAVRGQVENFATFLAGSPFANASNDIQLPAMFANPFESCTTFSKGSGVNDADYAVKFNCVGIQGPYDNVIDLVGSMAQKSVNGKPEEGYRFDAEIMQKSVFPTNTNDDTYKGFSELKVSATELRYTSDFEVQVKMTNHTPPVDYVWKRSVSRIYTPDDMNAADESGKISIQANYMMNGRVGGGPNQEDLGITKFGFSISSNELVYKKGCMTGFESGTVTFVDGANNKIVFEYLCDSKNLTLNGKPVN